MNISFRIFDDFGSLFDPYCRAVNLYMFGTVYAYKKIIQMINLNLECGRITFLNEEVLRGQSAWVTIVPPTSDIIFPDELIVFTRNVLSKKKIIPEAIMFGSVRSLRKFLEDINRSMSNQDERIHCGNVISNFIKGGISLAELTIFSPVSKFNRDGFGKYAPYVFENLPIIHEGEATRKWELDFFDSNEELSPERYYDMIKSVLNPKVSSEHYLPH